MNNEEAMHLVESTKAIYKTLNPLGVGLESTDGLEYAGLVQFLSSLNLDGGFIEVGSAWGASFHLHATAIPSGPKISIDLPTDQNSGFAPWPPSLTTNIMESRVSLWKTYFQDVHQIIGNSHHSDTKKQLSTLLNGAQVDFLYIDAEHSYDGCLADFNDYKEFVRPGGYVGFHDIQLTDPYFLDVLWSEIKGKYEEHYEFNSPYERIGLIRI